MRRAICLLATLTLIGAIMALHDVDKHNDDRGIPKLNQSDQLDQRKANSTTSIHPVTDSTTTSGYIQTKNGRILANNGTNNVGLFGFDSTGNMVVKVAKPGYDADTATASQLAFNSAQNTFKIVATGSSNITLSGGNTAGVTIAHNLGYTPAVLAFINNSGQYMQLPAVTAWNTGATLTPVDWFYVETDATNVYINAVYATGTTGTYSIKYYLLQETAN